MAYQKLQSGEFMVIGYVPKDAELKKVGEKNYSKTTFSVKASETTGPDGKKQPNWTSCVAWHDTARACENFKKGDVVMAVGKMESNEYEGKTYKNLVVEFAVKMNTQPLPQVEAPSGTVQIDDLSEFEEILSDGDIPF